MKKVGFLLALLALSSEVRASGFGLYEMSAASHALGGAVVGRAVDASANFFNPATLSDLTNVTVSVGFVTQHPRGRMKVGGADGSWKMDPGAFLLPHFQLAVPLPAGFTFGFGGYVECGLGSSYDRTWPLVNSSRETTVESFTLNPNLAYAITERWSVAAGLRFFYFDFEQYSEPRPGLVTHRLKGDNGLRDWGWQVGTRYRILDNFAIGLVYKSSLDVDVEGKSEVSGAQSSRVGASTDIEMPESLTGGFNWDISRSWHLGGAFTWTRWSTFDTLNFKLGPSVTPVRLRWEDTYRVSLAPSWDFAEDWTWMCAYAYETDCTDGQDSTMLPRADRHMLTTGLSWRCWQGLELTLSYGLILMDGGTTHATDVQGVLRDYCAHRGLSHAAGFTLTYRF